MTSDEYNVQELEELAELIGEETLADTLDSYSCPLNPEVEDFLKHKARHSSKIGASVTYLVSGEDGALLGYFTLLLKAFQIEASLLSSANRHLISRFAELDTVHGLYNAAVYLIAQIGKNFADGIDSQISGDVLLRLAFKILREARGLVGGKLVLVERECNRPKLLDFYKGNHFTSWNIRHSEHDGVDYDQMICNLGRKGFKIVETEMKGTSP